MKRLRNRIAVVLLMVATLPGLSVAADEIATPQGSVLLRMSGDIAKTNVGNEAHFDREMLAALPEMSITTTTIWTEDEQVFTGVALSDLLMAVGAGEGVLTATALNDYAIEIPYEDAAEGYALLAFERNGKPMSVREKGPLWIVYPYDSDAKFQSEVYYSRSIWQLDRLAVAR